MKSLTGTETLENLKTAFAGEAQSEPTLSVLRSEGR